MIARRAPRIFISAGEPSGDLHGAGVVCAAPAGHPNPLT
jgi:lipid A disaccharide synthetase